MTDGATSIANLSGARRKFRRFEEAHNIIYGI